MRVLILLALAACNGGTDIVDTDTDTDSTVGGTTTPPGTANVVITLDGDAGPWTVAAGDTGTIDVTFDWWNSSTCSDCDAVAVMVVDGQGFCTDLPSAGPEPGTSAALSEDVTFSGSFVDDAITLFVQEDLDCAAFTADRTSLTVAPSASMPLTQEVDLTIDSTAPEALETDVGINVTLSVSLSEPADLEGFPPTITFADADGGAVPFSSYLEGRFLRIDPDAPLQEFQTEYTVTVSGLVGVDGAEQNGTFTLTFTTELLNGSETYELYSVAHGTERIVHASTGNAVIIDGNFPGADDELWRFTQLTGSNYVIENVQTETLLTAPETNPLGAVPTHEEPIAESTEQVWSIEPWGDGWRITPVAHGVNVALDIGNDTTDTLALRATTATPQQEWRFTKVQ